MDLVAATRRSTLPDLPDVVHCASAEESRIPGEDAAERLGICEPHCIEWRQTQPHPATADIDRENARSRTPLRSHVAAAGSLRTFYAVPPSQAILTVLRILRQPLPSSIHVLKAADLGPPRKTATTRILSAPRISSSFMRT